MLLIGCSTALSPKEYQAWVHDPDNGYALLEDADSVQVYLIYKPAAYMALSGHQWKGVEDIDQAVEPYKENLYLMLRLQSKQQNIDPLHLIAQDSSGYREILDYAFSKLRMDLYAVLGTDTLYAKGMDMEPSYNTKSYQDFHFVFGAMPGVSKPVFVLDAKPLGLPPMKFQFKQEHLKETPELDL